MKKRGLGASREENQGQETGRVLGLRLGRVCWNQACTTPCAELGKLDFLFPKKSSYIRFSGQREKTKAASPSVWCSTPPHAHVADPPESFLQLVLSPFPS